jgi:hypothetical protein
MREAEIYRGREGWKEEASRHGKPGKTTETTTLGAVRPVENSGRSRGFPNHFLRFPAHPAVPAGVEARKGANEMCT